MVYSSNWVPCVVGHMNWVACVVGHVELGDLCCRCLEGEGRGNGGILPYHNNLLSVYSYIM